MDFIVLHEILLVFGLSVALGGFIGLDKNLRKTGLNNTSKKYGFAGARSFAIISFFGALMCYVDQIIGTQILFMLIGLAVVVTFVLMEFGMDLFRYGEAGPTTELITILVYFIGVLVYYGFYQIAIIISILLAIIIGAKQAIFDVNTVISQEELKTTIKFAVIAFVILPILPNPDVAYSIKDMMQFIMPGSDFSNITTPLLADLHFFNPYSIWKFVVIMSGISYLGYILTKFIDQKSSILFSAFLGGTVSSTAVTATMTQKSKEDPDNASSYTMGTLVATCVMFLRVIIVVAFLNYALFKIVIIPFILMFAGFLIMMALFYIKMKKSPGKVNVEQNVRSPFRIVPALQFAGIILLIKFLAGIGKVYDLSFLGEIYYYVIALISGLADVDGITYTMATDSLSTEPGAISLTVAAITIVIAVISNNFVKGYLISYKMGEKTYGKNVVKSFAFSIALGLIGVAGLLII